MTRQTLDQDQSTVCALLAELSEIHNTDVPNVPGYLTKVMAYASFRANGIINPQPGEIGNALAERGDNGYNDQPFFRAYPCAPRKQRKDGKEL